MEELGKQQSARGPQPSPWAGPLEKDTLLWKLKDCFSSFEKASPAYNDQRKMESRNPVLELKDVPPPPCHVSSASSSQPFPLAPLPLPLPLPCLPTTQLPLESHKHPQPCSQLQEGPSPKVSICAWCDHYDTVGYGAFGDTSVACNSNTSELVSSYMSPSAYKAPIGGSVGPAACSTAPLLNLYPNSPIRGSTSEASNALYSPAAYQLQFPSCVATSQPMSSHSCSPCCTGLVHPYSNLSLSHSHASLPSTSSGPPAPPLSALSTLSTPMHGSSGCCCPCCRTAAETQRTLLHGDLPSTSAQYCSHSRHLNVDCTVCLKGSHYCQQCLLKPVNGLLPEPGQSWPIVPHLSSKSTPIPIPMCNGCGTTSDGLLRIPQTSLGKAGHKFGSPESGGPENTPPVGVFWDIENCCVPSGRSAAAVVQRLRSRFFQGHREAEFICVCDISKECKAVIQDLNNCQVTVAHINATAKNAADDKLRQSLRRFAETHAAPATVVLVSSDVNFASELSDLRHRHGFQVILVHGTHASPALMQHAHRHVAFQEITADLPLRMPIKSQPSFNLLYVHNLPVICDKSLRNGVKLRLRRLSDNCGGKVLGVSQGTAVLRFGSLDAAERACKRMENEDVFGYRIRPSFSPRPGGKAQSPGPQPMPQAPPLAAPSAYMPITPPPVSSFSFLPLEQPRSPGRLRQGARPCQTSGPLAERPYSPRRGCSGPPGGPSDKPLQELGGVEACTTTTNSPPRSSVDSALEGLPKPGLIGESMYRRRADSSSPRRATESPMERGDRSSPEFLVSTPSAFSKLNLHSFSPLVVSQGSWSSRNTSPCLSSRSSPLLPGPRSPGPHGTGELLQDDPEVLVANLDYRMSRKELQQTLSNTFSRYGRVKCVELSPHTDYQLKATIQMVSVQQAISAVSRLHHYKIGGKRIHVSLATGGSSKSLATLSSEIMGILHDAPANCLPLSKFTELYEKRYSRKLAIGDLYRLPEVVAVRDQGGTRLVCLLSGSQARQSPLGSSQSQEVSSSAGSSPVVFEKLEYHEPLCRQHSAFQDFSEADFDPDSYQIPFVAMSLSAMASQVHALLQSHDGTLPLLSFPECYAAEFGPLELGDETQEGAVSLEHLITCIPSITVVTAQNGFKVVKWIHNKPPAPNSEPWIQRSKSPVGNPQLIQFSREVIDLLKSKPACLLPISKFIPSYHHHFAKQCRVSDYGYTKLLELLEAVPHVLQILGMGTKRLLTLTHRAQVKRFTQDLLKLLKFQASKQVAIKDFMQAYHWCFSRDWREIDYGICDLMDLLKEMPDTTVTITRQDTDLVISVPKRDRTAEEMERTKQFGKEVVDLLRHQPRCRMPFSKFIPTYHHHFGRQCKLTYYGFTKLLDLFDAIPEVLTVLECGEEKGLTLTEVERVKALAAQLVKLLRSQRNCSLPVGLLLAEYSKTFGYGLHLQDYDAASLSALLAKLCHVVKVVDGAEGKREVQLINRKSLRLLTCQLLALLMAQEEEHAATGVSVAELSDRYLAAHGVTLNPCEYGFLSLSELLKSLPYLVELYREDVGQDCDAVGGRVHGADWVRLTHLYQFARGVRGLLHTYHYNQIFLTEFSAAYGKFTGRSLQPRAYGYASVDELLGAIPQVVWIKGHGHKRIIVLKNDMKGKARTSSTASDSPQPHESRDSQSASPSSLADSGTGSPGDDDVVVGSELMHLTSPVDLLCGPVPSCLPSPQLHPHPVLLQHTDLIHFERSPPPDCTGQFPPTSLLGSILSVCLTEMWFHRLIHYSFIHSFNSSFTCMSDEA
ncbi:Meiosis regulator and mRNA stability factor 1 [Merluccius polli]|uniref:Meiosis regulator and mRNA stability factor 1 n=1 Tax=Merluccius polli TaxID=89951 RepID=A0AA47P8L6_MERPO|nr:Meiosis regulator and mRNA stability factor 1 [Merluccius polli]